MENSVQKFVYSVDTRSLKLKQVIDGSSGGLRTNFDDARRRILYRKKIETQIFIH